MKTINHKLIFLLATGLAGCCDALAGGPSVTAVQPVDHFLNPSAVAVHGMLGQAIGLGEQGRLRTLPAWNNGTLITMFSTEARNKNNTTDWYGEHAGKWLYSAALAVKRTGNDTLRALLFKTTDYLIDHQEADGYMGSYSPELRITNKNSKLHKKSWDVWSLSCTMLGLLQVHEQFGNARCLASAQKIGELLLATFGEGREDITNYGTRYGYSATIVLDPIVELYKTTGDKRYLDFANLIVRQVEQKEGLRFIAAALNNRDMETVADGKAYQIIWNITGLAKLYEVTGTPDYLKAVQNAWQNIHDYHLTVTGGPWGGIGKHKECFNTKGFWDPYGFIETCSIMSWIQLNKVLLHLTGEAKYAQEIEKSAYNALAGAQFDNGEDWTYHSFTNGRRHPANFNDCCPSSGVLAMEELSPLIYSRRNKGIACNLYADNDATVELPGAGNVHIVQKTGYPFDGKIRLEITPAGKASSFPLYIRIPEWATGAEIKVDGKTMSAQDIKSGSYFTIEKEWQKGSVIDINFPVALRLVQQSEYAIMPQG
ncbi:MAG: glycoside hydrolase family 127 protein, partial [Bacteroidetes bacterium]|nr:glycoside hydrolase family 127 protein [Bacteroidota bacterium]